MAIMMMAGCFLSCSLVSPTKAKGSSSLTFVHHHPKEQIHLYQVAYGNDEDGYTVHERFEPVSPDFSQNEASRMTSTARKLYNHAKNQNLEPDYISPLDEEGQTTIDGLDEGIYLATSPAYKHDETAYIINPTLVKARTGENPVNVLKSMLFEEVGYDLEVKKIWQDEAGNTIEPAADSVRFDVLKNGERYTTLVLGNQNDWFADCMIDELDAEWTVQETSEVPGFATYITQNRTSVGIEIIVSNKKETPPDPPKDPNKPDDPNDPDQPEPPSEPEPDPEDPGKTGNLDTSVETRWKTPAAGMLIAVIVGVLASRKKGRK